MVISWHDDEKPVVVVLGDGDLTAAEAETEMTGTDTSDDTPALPGAKIMFKKPVKRSGSKDQNDTISEALLTAERIWFKCNLYLQFIPSMNLWKICIDLRPFSKYFNEPFSRTLRSPRSNNLEIQNDENSK